MENKINIYLKSIFRVIFTLTASLLLLSQLGLSARNSHPAKHTECTVPPLVQAYKVSAADNLLLPGHLYSKSTGTSVGINQTHLGMGNIIAPPYFCYPFSSRLFLFNQPVPVANYDWYPAGTSLLGTSIKGVSSSLSITPLNGSRGILAEVTLFNTLNREINVPMEWQMEGRVGASENWDWYPPFAMKSNAEDIQVKADGDAVEYHHSSTTVLIKAPGFKTNPVKPNSLEGKIILQPQEKKSFSLVILLGNDISLLTKQAEQLQQNPGKVRQEAFVESDKLLKVIESKVPTLAGGSSELNAFYKKGILTFSTCRWEVPEFIASPWYAESGIDGGALNNYCWGVVYVSRLMSMIDPVATRKLLVAYVTSDLEKTYALNPATGKGMGVLYSYNYYSIARATYDYITITGDLGILNKKIGHETYLDYIYRFCLSLEDLKADPALIDFGGNHNMLELKKTTDYCHFTPSPNAERMLIYRYLGDFYSWLGKATPDDLKIRSEKFKQVFQSKLWNSDNKWLHSLNKDNQPTITYSVQVFDVLRTGILSEEQQNGIVNHLNTHEFLSPWGVHSLAVTDEGYDPWDVDWGGPGVYAGDAPELLEDLLNEGFADQGIDLLKRILWWGQFPYYPQAIRADKMGYREDGRPNVLAGLAAPQSILFGLFGITVGKDFISVNPVNHDFTKGLSLTNLVIRTKKIDISILDKKPEFSVFVGKKRYKSALGKPIVIKLADLSLKPSVRNLESKIQE
ncbi:MAG TPA: hypothetical protein VFG54_18285 [Prolixibacteraceae bacterium]|nr:hypothetical protein [Prolixibacteraceae bacterium]